MNTFEFDGKKYKLASKHQKEWGAELISVLSFKGNETVLDLGCGDGVLTEQLSLLVPYGKVLGIDASINMIETAKPISKNNLEFEHTDINKINYENEFDLIFSNAALHWIKDHKRLLKNAYKALKTHGKILWDFGGWGNCFNFLNVIQNKIMEDKYAQYFIDFEWPWFMPSKSQYIELISTIGFSAYTMKEVNKDRYFSNASEMIKWIDQPSIVPFIQYIPHELKETFRQEVIEEMLKRTQQPNGTCFETFRRIRIYAQK
ncbi:MAG: methyltransferase domain-containing protein [Lachnospiraceae bacterium]|nr:methyltransferase domain-containing protein [Lachnospiraceae bacterium]